MYVRPNRPHITGRGHPSFLYRETDPKCYYIAPNYDDLVGFYFLINPIRDERRTTTVESYYIKPGRSYTSETLYAFSL